MPTSKSPGNELEPLIPILKSQVIPCWERFGMDRLAVTAKTLKQFKLQSVPALMDTSVKKRTGKRVTTHSQRRFNNTTNFVESWPGDDQATFRFPALVFVIGGEAHFHVADYMVHCPSWHFLLFRTGVPRPLGNRPHLEGENADKGNCDILWVFTPPGTGSLIAYVCHCCEGKHWHDGYRAIHRSEAISLFKLLIDELEEESGNEKIIDLSFRTLLHLLLHELRCGRYYEAGTSPSKHTQEHSTSQIEQARQYIKSHLNHRLTTASVARQMYMSRNSFIERFLRETGQTFHDFVTRERMETAQQLLREEAWSVDLICRYVGLKPTQFRDQFKAYFGVTPSHFRKNGQNR